MDVKRRVDNYHRIMKLLPMLKTVDWSKIKGEGMTADQILYKRVNVNQFMLSMTNPISELKWSLTLIPWEYRLRKVQNIGYKLNSHILGNSATQFRLTYTSLNESFVIEELVDEYLNHWLHKERSIDEWYSMLFQVIYGIIILQEDHGIYHRGLDISRIAYFKVPDQNVKYKLLLTDYPPYEFQVPLYEHQFILTDFGMAEGRTLFKGTLTEKEIQLFIENNHAMGFLKRLALNIKINYIFRHKTLDQMMDEITKKEGHEMIS